MQETGNILEDIIRKAISLLDKELAPRSYSDSNIIYVDFRHPFEKHIISD